MNNRLKRFLLFYWYATNIYQYHGKGNRIILPLCLKSAIRARFPEPDGKYSEDPGEATAEQED